MPIEWAHLCQVLITHSASALTANQSQGPWMLVPLYLFIPRALPHRYSNRIGASHHPFRKYYDSLPVGLLSSTLTPFPFILHTAAKIILTLQVGFKIRLKPSQWFTFRIRSQSSVFSDKVLHDLYPIYFSRLISSSRPFCYTALTLSIFPSSLSVSIPLLLLGLSICCRHPVSP